MNTENNVLDVVVYNSCKCKMKSYFATGMYPPVEDTVWNTHLQWQPIPVHTVSENQDELLAMNKKCPKFDEEYNRVKNSAAYKKRLEKYRNLLL